METRFINVAEDALSVTDHGNRSIGQQPTSMTPCMGHSDMDADSSHRKLHFPVFPSITVDSQAPGGHCPVEGFQVPSAGRGKLSKEEQ